MPIIAPIPRTERRLMQKTIHKTRDKNHARRLTAMLMLHRGDRVSDVARTLCCARSSVGRWINWFTLSGIEGLKSLPAGRSRRRPFEHICTLLCELIKHSPGDFGYQRSRWSTELLAIKINEITGCQLHAGTVLRWLPSAGLVWRSAAPTLRIRDPQKDEKMAVIHKAPGEYNAEHPVFYEDEVIHLNPKISADWQVRGQQKRVVTPGQNEKYYLAGALHSGTGKVTCWCIGISIRTLQRWTDGKVITPDRRLDTVNRSPRNKLSDAERLQILELCNSPEFASLPPNVIVPTLADKGTYIASESTFYRVLKSANKLTKRSRECKYKRPDVLRAVAPNQVWSWDISYLPS